VLVSALLVGCNSKADSTKQIAIIKYVSHPALDELETAFVDRFEAIKTSTIGSDYEIALYNANADTSSVRNIAQSLDPNQTALILSIATPTAMNVSALDLDIPHLYGAVADPEGAGIIPSTKTTGIRNAGENIITYAVDFMIDAFPQNNRKLHIGTVYNEKEQNSVFVQDILLKTTKRENLDLTAVTVGSSSNFNGVANSLSDRTDVIYSANDNTVNSGIVGLTAVTNDKGIPFVIGDLSTLNKGALFAVGLSYESMGHDLAIMAVEIIKDGSVNKLPPRDAPLPEVHMNSSIASVFSYNLPKSLKHKYKIKEIK